MKFIIMLLFCTINIAYAGFSSRPSSFSSFKAAPMRTSTTFKGLSNVRPVNTTYKPASMSSFKSYNTNFTRPTVSYNNGYYHSSMPNILGYYLVFSMLNSHHVNSYPSCRCVDDKPIDCPKEVECKKKDW